MKTAIEFLDGETRKPSACGEPLEIEVSSAHLDWNGVLLEKGWSPFFHPDNVITESFYFALALDEPTEWTASVGETDALVKAEPGDIWINPPESPFSHRVEVPCYFIILCILPERLFRGSPVQFQLNFLNQYNIRDRVLSDLIGLFYHEVLNAGSSGPSYLDNLVRLFSDYFIKHYSDYEDQLFHANYSALNSDHMQRVNAVIQDRIAEEIRIDDLAFICGMSKFYFLKEFKKLNGTTPYRYVLQKKIDFAENLLRTTDKSIVEISIDAGFSDQSHFNRAFKQLRGTTPGRFRTSILK